MKKIVITLIAIIFTTDAFSQVLTRTFDRLKQETTFTVVINSNISINKYINPDDTMYQIVFYLRDSYLTLSASDIEVVFGDGTRISESGDVSLSSTNTAGVYGYSFYSYDESLVEKMSKVNMDGFIMSIWSREMTPQNQVLIKKGANLILSAK
jgi:hypothetical protein